MADLDRFLQEAYAGLEPLPDQTAEHRAYFDDQGKLLFYSMEDLPGNYVVVDLETWSRGPCNVRLRDGKLTWITAPLTSKLVPADHGTRCHPSDVTVITDKSPCQAWTKRDYDHDS